MPGMPRLAFEVIGGRDLADVHIRALVAEQAAASPGLAAAIRGRNRD